MYFFDFMELWYKLLNYNLKVYLDFDNTKLTKELFREGISPKSKNYPTVIKYKIR